MPNPALFQVKSFVSHSGQALPWKVECDALTVNDWEALAFIFGSLGLAFGQVVGVPTGGLAFADALQAYVTKGHPTTLIADDVLTTGASMSQMALKVAGPVIGVVAFSRSNDVPLWVTPIWRLTSTP